jgi:Uma2 family endonuclease
MLPTEYVNGEIIMAPSPTPLHQLTSVNIFTKLNEYVSGNSLGQLLYAPFDVVLPSGDVVQPDIFLLHEKDLRRVLADRRAQTTPPFVVEILSPGSVALDTLTKRHLYERSGVREYWIVDLQDVSVAQLVLRKKHYALAHHAEGDTIRSAVLAGFEMRVGELLGLGRGSSE